MTRVSLAGIIADELATLRRFDPGDRPSGRPRAGCVPDGGVSGRRGAACAGRGAAGGPRADRPIPGDRNGVDQFVYLYLSREHRDDRGAGCPSAALLDEVGRSSDAIRSAYTEGILGIVDDIAAILEPTGVRTILRHYTVGGPA